VNLLVVNLYESALNQVSFIFLTISYGHYLMERSWNYSHHILV